MQQVAAHPRIQIAQASPATALGKQDTTPWFAPARPLAPPTPTGRVAGFPNSYLLSRSVGELGPRLASFTATMPADLIPFAVPVTRPLPPSGDEWLHEVKFDGWRMQVHKAGSAVTLLSRNGHDLTGRFRQVAAAVKRLKSRALVLDCEVLALDDNGRPDFQALLRADVNVVLYVFDALRVGARDLRPLTLTERRQFARVLAEADGDVIRMSDTFDDPVALLKVLEPLGVEGIVSKRRDAPYRSGKRSGWIKVKTSSWRAANADRWETFEKRHQ